MRFSATLSALALPAFVAAQAYGPPPGPAPGSSSSSTSSSAAAAPTAPPSTTGFVNINVAFNQTFTFNPANVTAPNGTVVTFYFPNAGLTHSVTQSSFAEPCTFLAANATANTTAGFDSGLVQDVQFSINITDDSKPIWFHCKQVTHCGLGMVGSINAQTNGSNTYAAFLAAAKNIGSNEVTETDNGAVLSGVGATAVASPTNSAASSSSSSGSSASSATRVAAGAGAALFAGIFSVIVFA